MERSHIDEICVNVDITGVGGGVMKSIQSFLNEEIFGCNYFSSGEQWANCLVKTEAVPKSGVSLCIP